MNAVSVAVISFRADSAEEDTAVSVEKVATSLAVLSIRAGSAEDTTVQAPITCSDTKQRFSADQMFDWKTKSQELSSASIACYNQLLPLFDRNFQIRCSYVERFGWAVLDLDACAEIVAHTAGDILSICSGKAHYETILRHLLAFQGRVIKCSDIEPQPDAFMEVVIKSCVETVKDDGDTSKTLFVSWPECIVDICEAMRARPSHSLFPFVVYIGEIACGGTGNDRFHEFLQRNYTRIKVVKIPNWGNFVFSDKVHIFKRKNEFEDLPED